MIGRQATYKLVLLGESAVGKSSIVLRFVKSQFQENQEATIGVAYLTQSIVIGEPEVTVKFEIWDTAGQERYHSLAPMYYRGAQAAVIVYDIASKQSYNRAIGWVNELRERAPTVKVIALAGNKSDLSQQRQVSTDEAHNYAQENGLLFMETSAKVATNVLELFTTIAEKLPLTERTPVTNDVQRLGESSSKDRVSTCCK